MQHSRHLPDHFPDLVDHSFPDQAGLFISLQDQAVDGVSVSGPEHADKSAGPGAHPTDVVRRMGVHIVHQRQDRHPADARGGIGAVPAGADVPVHHTPLQVGVDGDPAVDMGHDEVTVLIAFPAGPGVLPGNGLLVQHVELGVPVHAPDAGQPGQVAQLVHVGWVQGVGGLSIFLPQLIRQHHTQLGRVVTAAHGVDRVQV